MAALAAVVGAIGSIVGTLGAVQQAQSQAEMADYQAAELKRVASEEKAAGALKAAEQRNAAKRVVSKANAISAGSGAPAAPGDTLIGLGGGFQDIYEEGLRLASEERFSGDARARGTTEQSKMKAFEADATRKQIPGMVAGGVLNTIGGIASAMPSMSAKYGGGGYKPNTAGSSWYY
jgi:hypothetical protein